MNILPPLNKCSVSFNDKYLIVKYIQGDDWQIVEGQTTLERAGKAKSILTTHDEFHGLTTIYQVVER